LFSQAPWVVYWKNSPVESVRACAVLQGFIFSPFIFGLETKEKNMEAYDESESTKMLMHAAVGLWDREIVIVSSNSTTPIATS